MTPAPSSTLDKAPMTVNLITQLLELSRGSTLTNQDDLPFGRTYSSDEIALLKKYQLYDQVAPTHTKNLAFEFLECHNRKPVFSLEHIKSIALQYWCEFAPLMEQPHTPSDSLLQQLSYIDRESTHLGYPLHPHQVYALCPVTEDDYQLSYPHYEPPLFIELAGDKFLLYYEGSPIVNCSRSEIRLDYTKKILTSLAPGTWWFKTVLTLLGFVFFLFLAFFTSEFSTPSIINLIFLISSIFTITLGVALFYSFHSRPTLTRVSQLIEDRLLRFRPSASVPYPKKISHPVGVKVPS